MNGEGGGVNVAVGLGFKRCSVAINQMEASAQIRYADAAFRGVGKIGSVGVWKMRSLGVWKFGGLSNFLSSQLLNLLSKPVARPALKYKFPL